jgi:hypothetical protein
MDAVEAIVMLLQTWANIGSGQQAFTSVPS